MTSQGLQSNESSVLLTSYAKAGLNDYSYSDSVSDPLVVRTHFSISPVQASSGPPVGGTIRFNIPRGSFLSNASLKTTFVKPAAGTITNFGYWGLGAFQSIELQANSKTLIRLDGASIKARVMNESRHKKEAMLRRALPMDPTTENIIVAGATQVVCYTPIFSSFFEGIKAYADLGFCEQMSIVATYYSSFLSLGSEVELSSASNELICYTNTYTSEYTNLIRSPFSSGSVNQLSYNYVSQSLAVAVASTTQTVLQLRTNSPVRRMFFFFFVGRELEIFKTYR